MEVLVEVMVEDTVLLPHPTELQLHLPRLTVLQLLHRPLTELLPLEVVTEVDLEVDQVTQLLQVAMERQQQLHRPVMELHHLDQALEVVLDQEVVSEEVRHHQAMEHHPGAEVTEVTVVPPSTYHPQPATVPQ